MPALARLFIKTSLVYLGAALPTALVIAVGPLVGWSSHAALWTWAKAPVWQWGLVASAALQWGGVTAYAAYIWSRVRTK